MSSDRPRRTIPAAVWAAGVCWLLLAGWGFVSYRTEGVLPRGQQMTVDRAVFTTVNAVTLTGFQQSIRTNDYGLPGRHATFALMVGGVVFTLFIGGCAVSRLLDLPWSDGTIFLSGVAALVSSVAVGMLLIPGGQIDAFTAAFQAVAALGNCGLYLGQLPTPMDWQTHLVLLPLAMIGGLGLPVLMDVLSAWHRRRPIHYHSQIVFGTAACIYLLGFIILGGMRLWLDGADLAQALAGASVTSVNARNAGFPLESVAGYARAAQWMVLVLMFIGAAPGGTGSGLKTTTLFEIGHGIRRALRHRSADRTFAIALCWLALLMGFILITHLALLITEPQLAADRVLFLAVSAVTNTGLSHDPVMIVGPGLYILSLAMLLGRITPLLILWWLACTTDDAPLAVG